MKASFLILLLFPLSILAQTTLEGKVIDAKSSEPILFGTVALFQNGKLIKGVETNLSGSYNFKDLKPGYYDIEASYVGYTPSRVTNYYVLVDHDNKMDIKINEGVLAEEFKITQCGLSIIRFDDMESGAVFNSIDIRRMPIPR